MQAHLSFHDDAFEWQEIKKVSLRWVQILSKVKMLIFLNDLEVPGATVLDFIILLSYLTYFYRVDINDYFGNVMWTRRKEQEQLIELLRDSVPL